MDRAVIDSIEHEVHKRFPGDAVQRAVLLHYGDDPEIEPGELWVRVFLRADRPEDYEQILRAFDRDHQAAIESSCVPSAALAYPSLCCRKINDSRPGRWHVHSHGAQQQLLVRLPGVTPGGSSAGPLQDADVATPGDGIIAGRNVEFPVDGLGVGLDGVR
jgi:hypothetical protein